ncbi:MAG: 6-bladed beta-propeller [Candidatus Marinimicrobia bacterium]|nr:6-bladed beta-propeller [Candidatus Neomarinimicrobiota bacterium]MCF7829998.1 6-bladed beta-propeller [Candidatus Neomarinimicrobiota bacterium]MCF7881848.1 6-bladed beta-propeller [Candidatus Neomarinimicrobiota bacterium]
MGNYIRIVLSIVIIAGVSTRCFADDMIQKVREINHERFYRLKEITSDGSKTFVLDEGNLKVFVISENGELITSFGRQGKGPGEFVEPVDIVLHNDTLAVLEHSGLKVVQFDTAGTFLNEFSVKQMLPFSFNYSDGEYQVVTLTHNDGYLQRYSVSGQLIKSNVVDGSASEPLSDKAPQQMQIFSKMNFWTNSNYDYYAGYFYKPVIEKYNSNFRNVETATLKLDLPEPSVELRGNAAFIRGEPIVYDIQYFNGALYALWWNRNLQQIECNGFATLSKYSADLILEEKSVLPDCLLGFHINNGFLYGICNEPVPKVVIYALE